MSRSKPQVSPLRLAAAALLAGVFSVSNNSAQAPSVDCPGALNDALKIAEGNFLLHLQPANQRSYVWTETFTESILDSRGAVLEERLRLVQKADLVEGARRRVWKSGPNGSPNSQPCFRWRPSSPETGRAIRSVTSFQPAGMDNLDGRISCVFSFSTSDEAPDQPLAREALKSDGRLWIDLEDHRIVQVEGRYRGSVSLSWAPFASSSIDKGTRWRWRTGRRGRAWLPLEWSLSIPMNRSFFFLPHRVQRVSCVYSDHAPTRTR